MCCKRIWLASITSGNHLRKYADEWRHLVTYILIPAINVSTRHAELASIAHWAQANNLILNSAKSQEILFSDKRRKKFSAPAEIAELKRVQTIEILGHTATCGVSLSVTACSQCHSIMRPNTICLACSPRPWVICDRPSALEIVYRAVVVAKLTIRI